MIASVASHAHTVGGPLKSMGNAIFWGLPWVDFQKILHG